jgi:hypothetical protein
MQSVFQAVWGEDTGDDGGEFPNDGADSAGVFVTGSVVVRTVNRFNLRAAAPSSGQWIPNGSTITVVSHSINVQSTVSAGAESWDIKRYGSLGDDAEPDAAATAFSRCNSSATVYVTGTTNFRTTGVKTNDLGSSGVADAQDRINNDSAVWSISIKQTSEAKDGSSNGTVVDEYTAATAANRPQLAVTWKAVRDPIGGCGMCCPGQRL